MCVRFIFSRNSTTIDPSRTLKKEGKQSKLSFFFGCYYPSLSLRNHRKQKTKFIFCFFLSVVVSKFVIIIILFFLIHFRFEFLFSPKQNLNFSYRHFLVFCSDYSRDVMRKRFLFFLFFFCKFISCCSRLIYSL